MIFSSTNQLWTNDNLLVGISELSEMTGVSTRQLRYWEKKGFITSIEKQEHAARKYDLPTVGKVEMIKHFLDEGFVLAKAVEKADSKITSVKQIRQVLKQALKDLTVIDQRYTKITLGYFQPNQEELILIHDNQTNQLHYEINATPAPTTMPPHER
ncbi:MAG: MerR family transcriptional regulator [Enterococcus sp.]